MSNKTLSRFLTLANFILLLFVLTTFQAMSQTVRSGQNNSSPLAHDLDSALRKYDLIKLNADALSAEVGRTGRFAVDLEAQKLEFSLVPRDLRASRYRAEETTNGVTREIAAPRISTFKGLIAGETNSHVRLTVSPEKIEGVIWRGGEQFFLETAKHFSASAENSDFVLYRTGDVLHKVSTECASEHLHDKFDKAATRYAPDAAMSGLAAGSRVVELATEADFDYVSVTGGSLQANAEILSIINVVEGAYESQVGLTFNVVFQHTWATADPYPQTSPNDILGLLEAFRNYWNANFPAAAIPRDLAHLFTNKALYAGNNSRGIAYNNVVCTNPNASYSLHGRRPESFAFNLNYLLTAHEIGHNFGATHVDASQSCENSIMNAIVSNISPLEFCPTSRGQITNFVAANSGCLATRSLAKTRFDFDGDDKTDVSVFRPLAGSWYILNSGVNSFSATGFGQNGDKIVPEDYDGDRRTDIAVYRNGAWYILYSSNGSFNAVGFGLSTDIPAPADFNGDGRAEVAVFRPSNGTWYVLNAQTNSFTATGFGQNGDTPVASDYDGDGRADISVFRASAGSWYRLNSGNGSFSAIGFGQERDRPVPADYDADGKTDVAVFRPVPGAWYISNSSNGAFTAVGFGIAADTPVAGDYDGDGRADVAVFRPGLGAWYRINSTNSQFVTVGFGQAGDFPIPAAYTP